MERQKRLKLREEERVRRLQGATNVVSAYNQPPASFSQEQQNFGFYQPNRNVERLFEQPEKENFFDQNSNENPRFIKAEPVVSAKLDIYEPQGQETFNRPEVYQPKFQNQDYQAQKQQEIYQNRQQKEELYTNKPQTGQDLRSQKQNDDAYYQQENLEFGRNEDRQNNQFSQQNNVRRNSSNVSNQQKQANPIISNQEAKSKYADELMKQIVQRNEAQNNFYSQQQKNEPPKGSFLNQNQVDQKQIEREKKQRLKEELERQIQEKKLLKERELQRERDQQREPQRERQELLPPRPKYQEPPKQEVYLQQMDYQPAQHEFRSNSQQEYHQMPQKQFEQFNRQESLQDLTQDQPYSQRYNRDDQGKEQNHSRKKIISQPRDAEEDLQKKNNQKKSYAQDLKLQMEEKERQKQEEKKRQKEMERIEHERLQREIEMDKKREKDLEEQAKLKKQQFQQQPKPQSQQESKQSLAKAQLQREQSDDREAHFNSGQDIPVRNPSFQQRENVQQRENQQQQRETYQQQRETYQQQRETYQQQSETYQQQRETYQQQRETYQQQREQYPFERDQFTDQQQNIQPYSESQLQGQGRIQGFGPNLQQQYSQQSIQQQMQQGFGQQNPNYGFPQQNFAPLGVLPQPYFTPTQQMYSQVPSPQYQEMQQMFGQMQANAQLMHPQLQQQQQSLQKLIMNKNEFEVYRQILEEQTKVQKLYLEEQLMLEQYRQQLKKVNLEKQDFDKQILRLKQELELKRGEKIDIGHLSQIVLNPNQYQKEVLYMKNSISNLRKYQQNDQQGEALLNQIHNLSNLYDNQFQQIQRLNNPNVGSAFQQIQQIQQQQQQLQQQFQHQFQQQLNLYNPKAQAVSPLLPPNQRMMQEQTHFERTLPAQSEYQAIDPQDLHKSYQKDEQDFQMIQRKNQGIYQPDVLDLNQDNNLGFQKQEVEGNIFYRDNGPRVGNEGLRLGNEVFAEKQNPFYQQINQDNENHLPENEWVYQQQHEPLYNRENNDAQSHQYKSLPTEMEQQFDLHRFEEQNDQNQENSPLKLQTQLQSINLAENESSSRKNSQQMDDPSRGKADKKKIPFDYNTELIRTADYQKMFRENITQYDSKQKWYSKETKGDSVIESQKNRFGQNQYEESQEDLEITKQNAESQSFPQKPQIPSQKQQRQELQESKIESVSINEQIEHQDEIVSFHESQSSSKSCESLQLKTKTNTSLKKDLIEATEDFEQTVLSQCEISTNQQDFQGRPFPNANIKNAELRNAQPQTEEVQRIEVQKPEGFPLKKPKMKTNFLCFDDLQDKDNEVSNKSPQIEGKSPLNEGEPKFDEGRFKPDEERGGGNGRNPYSGNIGQTEEWKEEEKDVQGQKKGKNQVIKMKPNLIPQSQSVSQTEQTYKEQQLQQLEVLQQLQHKLQIDHEENVKLKSQLGSNSSGTQKFQFLNKHSLNHEQKHETEIKMNFPEIDNHDQHIPLPQESKINPDSVKQHWDQKNELQPDQDPDYEIDEEIERDFRQKQDFHAKPLSQRTDYEQGENLAEIQENLAEIQENLAEIQENLSFQESMVVEKKSTLSRKPLFKKPKTPNIFDRIQKGSFVSNNQKGQLSSNYHKNPLCSQNSIHHQNEDESLGAFQKENNSMGQPKEDKSKQILEKLDNFWNDLGESSPVNTSQKPQLKK